MFALLTKNLQSKSFAFTLSEEEQAAVDSVEAIFDPTEEDRALTEAGTQGFVRRKRVRALLWSGFGHTQRGSVSLPL